MFYIPVLVIGTILLFLYLKKEKQRKLAFFKKNYEGEYEPDGLYSLHIRGKDFYLTKKEPFEAHVFTTYGELQAIATNIIGEKTIIVEIEKHVTITLEETTLTFKKSE
jgi:hypothetical protein